MAEAVIERPKQNRMSVRKSSSGMRSLPGFGGNQFPVRITCANVACEGPDIGNVRHSLGISVDDLAVLVARDRNKPGLEAYGPLRIAATYFGSCDIGIVYRHEPT